MKRVNSIFYLIISLWAITLTSCEVTEDENPQESSTTQAGFFYGENSTTTLTKADDAQVNKGSTTIIATKNNKTVVEINLTDIKAGTYSLSAKYAFTYVKDGKHWEATAGTLQITKNDGSKISGTYEATAGAGVPAVTAVKGNFTDVPLK